MAPRRLTDTDLTIERVLRRACSPGHTRTSLAQRTVARRAGYSEVTVRLAYRRLESWGRLMLQARPVATGGRLPDVAVLTVRTYGSDLDLKAGTSRSFGPTEEAPVNHHPHQASFLPPAARRQRAPSDLDRDLQVFRDAYEEAQGRPLRRASLQQWREEGRHLRRLRVLLPDEVERHAFLRAWADETDPYVVQQGHLMRHALLEWRFHKLVLKAERAVEDANYLAQFDSPYGRAR